MVGAQSEVGLGSLAQQVSYSIPDDRPARGLIGGAAVPRAGTPPTYHPPPHLIDSSPQYKLWKFKDIRNFKLGRLAAREGRVGGPADRPRGPWRSADDALQPASGEQPDAPREG